MVSLCRLGDVAGREEEMENSVEHIDKLNSMEISTEKNNMMSSNISNITAEIKLNEQRLVTVTRIKYLLSVITDEGSKPQIFS